DAEDIAFRIAPRINAAGRLGQARLAVELLTTRDPDRANELAQYLHSQNELRQTVERRIAREAQELTELEHDLVPERAIVLGDGGLSAALRIDAEVPLGDVPRRLLRDIEALAPFGAGNRRPLVMAARVEVAGPAKRIGGGERHLAFVIRQNGAAIRAVAFGM